jgi:NADH-quinone oxidoreductase subunit N
MQASPDFQVIARQTGQLIMPEVILTLFACAALVLDVMLPRERKRLVAWMSLAGVGFALLSLGILYFAAGGASLTARSGFFDMIVIDNYAVVFKLIFLIGAGLTILLSIKYLDIEGEQRGEYYALILFSVVGMMFMASGIDLLSLFISLELMAISVYILVGFFKRDKRSNEASMKYFLLGAFSSGVLLYGISLIYGLTGTTNLANIAAALPKVIAFGTLETSSGTVFIDQRYLLLLSVILMAAGMFFKVAVVPFHMWAPDAYEGAPTSITAFMSVGVKAASFAMFGRLFLYGLPGLRSTMAGDPANNIAALPGWALLLGLAAAITIVWGSLGALTQQNTKRLLAYSSISHAGFTLLGLVAGNQTGYTGFIIYLFVYTVMNLGVFGCIIALRRRGIIGDRMDDFNGLMGKAPWLTVMMTIFLLSLGGIPPTAGFVGKLWLFMGLVESGNPWLIRLAILASVMTVVSLFYYLRFIVAMYINPETETQPVKLAPSLQVVLAAAALFVILVGIFPQRIIGLTQRAASSQGITVEQKGSKGSEPPAAPVSPRRPTPQPPR